MKKVLLMLVVFASAYVQAQYTDNGDCVDAGPECTDIISGVGGGVTNVSGGTDTHIGPTDSGTSSSDSCGAADAPIVCNTTFDATTATVLGIALGYLHNQAVTDFLTGYPTYTTVGPFADVSADLASQGVDVFTASLAANPDFSDFGPPNGIIMDTFQAHYSAMGADSPYLDLGSGPFPEIRGALAGSGADIASILGMGAGAATIFLQQMVTPPYLGNDSNSGNMNYSSIGSHMLPESGTVPSSVYSNYNPMSAFAPKNPACMFQQGGC